MIDVTSFSDHLQLAADGIWYAADKRDVSYPEHGNEACFALEEDSFWFRHRNACIAATVQNFPPSAKGPVFDIGGGNGFVAVGLQQAGFDVVLVEPGRQGAQNGLRRGLPTVVCAAHDTARFRLRSIPAVGLFDVIEHVEDDRAFLESIASLLTPNGRLYATVPTYQFLWSAEDVDAGHFRRYTAKTIRAVLEAAGFRIDFGTYFFRFLPLPIFLLRSLPHRLGLRQRVRESRPASKDHDAGNGIIAKTVDSILAAELSQILARRAISMGSSYLLVASVR